MDHRDQRTNVIPFPVRNKNSNKDVAYKIPLYGDEQVKLIVAVVNIYGNIHNAVTEHTIKHQDPVFVVDCLKKAYKDYLFSTKAKAIINQILSQIEEVRIRKG